MENPVFKLEKVVHSRTEEMQDFEGPLDLILFLLSKNKMEIQDISISLICDQYLLWLEQRQKMDLEVASEFVTMASQLVYIKTRMLLTTSDFPAVRPPGGRYNPSRSPPDAARGPGTAPAPPGTSPPPRCGCGCP